MRGRRYFVRQARLDRSSHYSEIKMRSVSLNQFLDSFENEGGDFEFQFEGTATKLTIPLHDVIHASKTVMILVHHSRKAVRLQNCFRSKNPSMHIISSASSLLSTTVTLAHVQCCLLHTNKQGWMPPLSRWLRRRIQTHQHELFRPVFLTSCHSIPMKCASFSISLIAIVNMHSSTA